MTKNTNLIPSIPSIPSISDLTHDDFMWPFEKSLNQIINNFFTHDRKSMLSTISGHYPLMNVVEEDGYYKIVMAASGMTAEDVDIQIKDRMLTVKGRMSKEFRPKEGSQVHHRELRQSAFSRCVQLPKTLDGLPDPEATMKDGVLVLSWKLPENKEIVKDVKKISVKNL